MFIILLEFSGNKAQAGQHMPAHKDWLQRGFDDGAFLLAGSLEPSRGGAILATAPSLADLQQRIADDPFVAQNIVTATILEIDPSRADPRLAFLIP